MDSISEIQAINDFIDKSDKLFKINYFEEHTTCIPLTIDIESLFRELTIRNVNYEFLGDRVILLKNPYTKEFLIESYVNKIQHILEDRKELNYYLGVPVILDISEVNKELNRRNINHRNGENRTIIYNISNKKK